MNMSSNNRRARVLEYMQGFLARDAAEVVHDIQQGRNLATQAVALLGTSPRDDAFRRALVEAGLIPVVLAFLQNSADQSFAETLPNGGDLFSPSIWVNVLANCVAEDNFPQPVLDENRLLISQQLGPLASCMSGSERKCFQSRDYWLACLPLYAGLLYNLTLSQSAVPLLMEQLGIVDFLVQFLFCERFRPDLMRELKNAEQRSLVTPNCCNVIQRAAAEAIRELCDVEHLGFASGQRPFTDQGVERLQRLANTKVVSSDYQPVSSNVEDMTLAFGLLEVLYADEDISGRPVTDALVHILQQLSCGDGLGSDGAVVRLVEIGMATKTTEVACGVIPALFASLVPYVSGLGNPDDERFALAIEAGLFEMCLRMPEPNFRFHDGEVEMLMMEIFNAAGAVAVSRKSGNAIRSKESEIRKVTARATQRGGASAKKFAKLALEILEKAIGADSKASEGYSSGGICRWCHKILQSNEKKQCAGCKRAIYCSRECQAKDWKENGHKRECKAMATSDIQAAASGASKKEIKNSKRMEKNISVAGNNLFSEKREDIMYQASLRGYEILDCVVELDFGFTPTRILTRLATDYLEEARVAIDPENYEHTKWAVERNRNNGALSITCIAPVVGGLAGPSQRSNVLLKTLPSQAASMLGSESWTAYQKSLAQRRWGDSLDRIRSDPERLEQLLKELTRE